MPVPDTSVAEEDDRCEPLSMGACFRGYVVGLTRLSRGGSCFEVGGAPRPCRLCREHRRRFEESSPSPVRSDGAATASLNGRPQTSGGLPKGEILSQLRCKLAPSKKGRGQRRGREGSQSVQV